MKFVSTDSIRESDYLTFGAGRNDEPLGWQLADEIIAMDGITLVHVERHSVTVHKAELFTWDELLPKVEEIVRVVMAVHQS